MEVFADPPFAPRPNTATAMTQIVLRLTDGTTPIRGMVVPGKGQWFSVYDFMWNTGSFSSKNAVTTIFSRMISDKSEHKEEVTSMCCYLKFPGPGQRGTPCMSVMGLQRLLCLLGGGNRAAVQGAGDDHADARCCGGHQSDRGDRGERCEQLPRATVGTRGAGNHCCCGERQRRCRHARLL